MVHTHVDIHPSGRTAQYRIDRSMKIIIIMSPPSDLESKPTKNQDPSCSRSLTQIVKIRQSFNTGSIFRLLPQLSRLCARTAQRGFHPLSQPSSYRPTLRGWCCLSSASVLSRTMSKSMLVISYIEMLRKQNNSNDKTSPSNNQNMTILVLPKVSTSMSIYFSKILH